MLLGKKLVSSRIERKDSHQVIPHENWRRYALRNLGTLDFTISPNPRMGSEFLILCLMAATDPLSRCPSAIRRPRISGANSPETATAERSSESTRYAKTTPQVWGSSGASARKSPRPARSVARSRQRLRKRKERNDFARACGDVF